jgi:hypothetical protein
MRPRNGTAPARELDGAGEAGDSTIDRIGFIIVKYRLDLNGRKRTKEGFQ